MFLHLVACWNDSLTSILLPLIPLIKNAGGHISTWDGKDPKNGGNIVASSNKQVHKKILNLLKPYYN